MLQEQIAANEIMMRSKIQKLQDERQQVEAIILRATLTIQKWAKGWITRRKV
jgi:hypothetical protein